jgi:hypothetical protein
MAHDSDTDTDNDDVSFEDILDEATRELTVALDTLSGIVQGLNTIHTKSAGICVCIGGQNRPLLNVLDEWRREYENDTIHQITWGQFLIEKLRSSGAT